MKEKNNIKDNKIKENKKVKGDIIKEINRQPVKSLKDYTEALGKIKKGESFKIFIWRDKVGFVIAKLTK